MNWTSDIPTEPGWYWVTGLYGNTKPVIIDIPQPPYGNTDNMGAVMDLSGYPAWNMRFWGPIPAPCDRSVFDEINKKRCLHYLSHVRMVLESVPADEATQEAGLWQGDAIPRAIEFLDEAVEWVKCAPI